MFLAAMTGLALTAWAMVDALRASCAQWNAIGRRRLVWVAAIGASLFVGPAGALVAVFYLLTVRPALAAARTVES